MRIHYEQNSLFYMGWLDEPEIIPVEPELDNASGGRL